MQEFGFELALCAVLERSDRIVARQLGAHVHGRRIADTVLLEPGPEFEARTRITDERIPDPLIEADIGPGRAREVTDALDTRPDRARSLAERGVDIGFLESERHNGRLHVRQTTRYPDRWVDRIVGIENKPDLDRPGNLQTQLRTDVSLGLFDEVILATSDYVTGAHLNRIPEEVGVWRFFPDSGEREVVREPTSLDPDAPGVELLERTPARTDIAVASAEQKARARRRLAERAYGKGWRTFEWPGCARSEPTGGPTDASVPYCPWAGRIVDPATDCGPDCAGFEAAEPPDIDSEAERATNTAWTQDPAGHQRRQSGLDRFS